MTGNADLLIVDGRVFRAFGPREIVPYGSDIGPRPVAGDTAVAIKDGRIAWIGRHDDGLRDWQGPETEVIDARGGLVTAGFDDAHIHVVGGAQELADVDLFQLDSVSQPSARSIARHAAERPGDPWVKGRGWMYVPFPGGLPTRQQLDAVVLDRPAFMRCYDGHTAWVNSAALRVAGHRSRHPGSQRRRHRPGPADRRTDRRPEGGRAGTRPPPHPEADRRGDAGGDAREHRGDARGRDHRHPGRLDRSRRAAAVACAPRLGRPPPADPPGAPDATRSVTRRLGANPRRVRRRSSPTCAAARSWMSAS